MGVTRVPDSLHPVTHGLDMRSQRWLCLLCPHVGFAAAKTLPHARDGRRKKMNPTTTVTLAKRHHLPIGATVRGLAPRGHPPRYDRGSQVCAPPENSRQPSSRPPYLCGQRCPDLSCSLSEIVRHAGVEPDDTLSNSSRSMRGCASIWTRYSFPNGGAAGSRCSMAVSPSIAPIMR
jgi:hypothetical protein